jgi:hypothetical protein
MKSRLALIAALMTVAVALPATGATSPEEFSFGVPSEAPETTKMEFEQWLRQRLMSAMTPFLENTKILVTVKVTLQPEPKSKTKKAEVFLSKFDTRDVLEYDPHAQENKPKPFLQKVKKIEIALAHDGTLSEATVANLKTLATNLIAGVPSSKIHISTLAFAPAKVDIAANPEAGSTAPRTPTSYEPSRVGVTPDSSSFLRELSNFQILIASLLLSSVFGGVMLTMRNRRVPEAAPQAPRPSSSKRPVMSEQQGLRARETPLGQKMARWLIELSPEQLARLTREDVKFGVALCHVAGEERASAVTAGMSNDLIEAVTQAFLIWRFDQLEVFAGKFTEMVNTEFARDSHGFPAHDFVHDVRSEIVVEAEDGPGLPPAEFLFSLPGEILKASFSKLSNADKLGLVLTLDSERRAEFVSVVAPIGSKLRDSIELDLEEARKDAARSEAIHANRDSYLLSLSRACRDLLELDESFREQVLPLWNRWRQQRTSDHAA